MAPRCSEYPIASPDILQDENRRTITRQNALDQDAGLLTRRAARLALCVPTSGQTSAVGRRVRIF